MKRLFLAMALVATLVAVYFAPKDEPSLIVPAKLQSKSAGRADMTSADGSTRLNVQNTLTIHRRQDDLDLGNIFAKNSWVPPEIIATVKEPKSSPVVQAPPLPFRYLGRWVDNNTTTFFLQFNDRNLALSVGDTVDDTYSFDEMSVDTLTFTYLPLKEKQTLVVGEVK